MNKPASKKEVAIKEEKHPANQQDVSESGKKLLHSTPSKSRRALTRMPTSYPEINGWFHRIRSEKDLTLDDFAKLLDLNPSTARAYNYNDLNLSLYAIKQLKKHSKYSYNQLLEGHPGEQWMVPPGR